MEIQAIIISKITIGVNQGNTNRTHIGMSQEIIKTPIGMSQENTIRTPLGMTQEIIIKVLIEMNQGNIIQIQIGMNLDNTPNILTTPSMINIIMNQEEALYIPRIGMNH